MLGVPVEHTTEPQVDFSTIAPADVEVVFRNHRARLIQEIRRFPVILGCVAWLTDKDVLEALAQCRHVSLLVQKEDFLRPDLGGHWGRQLRRLYDKLPSTITRYGLPGGISDYSYASDPSIAAVRCVGNHNRDKLPAWPRMHNKFLIFCDHGPDLSGDLVVRPRRVWTGSYNISVNAAASFENAVLLDSSVIAEAYTHEFAQIMVLSEPLDWTSDWVAPEYRIGS